MKRHVRLYSVLVVAQAACLALGIWLEQPFRARRGPLPEFARPGRFEPVADRAAEGGLPEETSATPPREAQPETSATEIRVLAFTWITALQAAVAYLVLTRVQDQNCARRRVPPRCRCNVTAICCGRATP